MARRKLDLRHPSAENIRQYFCTNQRRLHRRFVRYIGVAVLTMLTMSNVFHFISWNDRAEMHGEFLDMKTQTELNRKMLDARAKIQITLIKTGTRRNAFSADEKQTICSLWSEAEYDRTGEKCPE